MNEVSGLIYIYKSLKSFVTQLTTSLNCTLNIYFLSLNSKESITFNVGKKIKQSLKEMKLN